MSKDNFRQKDRVLQEINPQSANLRQTKLDPNQRIQGANNTAQLCGTFLAEPLQRCF
jgi:hypothetical protein